MENKLTVFEREFGLVVNEDGKVVVGSRTIAEKYGKEHKHVLRDIRNLINDVPEAQSNFGLSNYINENNREMPEYSMDRQGFSMLVLGFNGKEAKVFTYKYTKAFEDMIEELEHRREQSVDIEMIDIPQILLVIDDSVLDKYNKYYFNLYPNRRKPPIEKPTHPSINKWMIMKRPIMNALKQSWKHFMIWFVEDQGLTNKGIDKCSMTFISYFKTRIRKDCDNTVPKFILDGLSESGLIVDDDSLHVESLTLRCGYDKERPRTEIYIDFE